MPDNNHIVDANKLLLCPFCGMKLFGGTNIHRKATMRHPYNSDCPLSEAEFLDTPGFHDRWNRRPSPENKALALCDEVERLRGENDQIRAERGKAHVTNRNALCRIAEMEKALDCAVDWVAENTAFKSRGGLKAAFEKRAREEMGK